jgi:hypothetical protein
MLELVIFFSKNRNFEKIFEYINVQYKEFLNNRNLCGDQYLLFKTQLKGMTLLTIGRRRESLLVGN